ncbi:hypothetical protein FXO37_20690 [Capsicum annuum]|nr:hypothetical protein FXO37_20690 [Capsicum annuum]
MKLLSQILKQQSLNVVSSNEGAQKMSSALRCKKVSIVLDDVDNDNQLEYLVGGRGWFGDESRIITTTSRNIDLLQKHDEIYRVPELSIDEALELFQKFTPNSQFSETFPANLGDLEELEELYAGNTAIWQLPDSVQQLSRLTVLSSRRGWKGRSKSPGSLVHPISLNVSFTNYSFDHQPYMEKSIDSSVLEQILSFFLSDAKGFAICCVTCMGAGVYDPGSGLSGKYDYTSIKAKLICNNNQEKPEVLEKECKVGTASRTCGWYVCFAYIPLYFLLQVSGADARNLSQYCLFKASINNRIARQWEVHLVYKT